MADKEWAVKQSVQGGNTRTLHSGNERTARAFVRDNFPRPHAVQGSDEVTADVQLHSPDGTRYEYHGVDAVGADDDGWINLDQQDDEPDDEPDTATPAERDPAVTTVPPTFGGTPS